MMTKIDNPKRYTEEDANKEFYPYSYAMANTARENGVFSGDVVAYSALDEKSDLLDYTTELNRGGKHGFVVIRNTKDPLDGGALLYELYQDDRE